MAGRVVLLQMDEESIPISFQPDQVTFASALDAGRLVSHLNTSRQAILDLVDARLTLVDAILEGQLDLIGEATDLGLLYETLLTYLRGAVRCPSIPSLLDQFRDEYQR